MKKIVSVFLVILLCILVAESQVKKRQRAKAIFLADLSWVEAEKVLTPDTIVVIPLGAQAKEHGPHLPLAADFIQAEYFKDRVAERHNVVIAPTVNYGFYPAFGEYPGSTTLSLSDSRGTIVGICNSLSRYGVRKFYVINIGISTLVPLKQAADALKDRGILFRYTNLDDADTLLKDVKKQTAGTHADEIETSQMLYIAPSSVDMRKAVKDGIVKGPAGGLTRDARRTIGIYSPSGIFGDATLATREKGKKAVEAVLSVIETDLAGLSTAEIPIIIPPEVMYKEFVGKYEISPTESLIISIEGGRLAFPRRPGATALLTDVGNNRFEFSSFEFIFIADSAGKVTHVLFYRDGRNTLARKLD